MALQPVVSPLLELLLDKLNSLITRKFRFNKDLQKLRQIVFTIKTDLEKPELKQIKSSIETQTCFLDLKETSHDAEDLLEEIELEAEIGENTEQTGKQIKELIQRFEKIDAQRLKFHLNQWADEIEVEWINRHGNTFSSLMQPIVCGRARETENIIEILLNNTRFLYDLSICPIVGKRGLGKTIVAQLVYGDERIVNHFDTQIWVSVSEEFDVRQIVTKMIDKLLPGEGIVDLHLKQNQLKLLLNGRKFLVVLDDVWDDDREKWNELTQLFACGGKGSSVIVTTRLQPVVDNITNLSASCVVNSTCDLQPLQEHDSWSLFKHYAFREGDEKEEDLIEIGKLVVRKCKGIPLAIKEVGIMLNSKGKEFWRRVRDGELWDPEELKESNVRASLKVRYNRLPPIHRQCFAYCSIFPKGHEIEVEALIKLWMTNGFVQTGGTIMELEDAANEIFKELMLKSFFPNVEENWLGIKIFKMQDFLHDLACLVARTECVALQDGDQLATIRESVRHILVSDNAQSSGMAETISNSFPQLRTCLFPPMYSLPLPIIYKNLTCLRALHLRGSNISNLPRSIKNLKHLRYLNLSSSVNLQLLPESISSLRFLQTLELSQCWKLQTLPKSIGKLINLRYLYLSDCRSLIQLPDGIGEMISLVHLDLSECDSLIRIPDAIGQLRNLKHLDLHDCETLSHLPDVIGQLANLIYLDISRCPDLYGLSRGIANLFNLRRLNLSKLHELTHLPLVEFILGSDSGLSIRQLHGLNNLEGELQIRGLGHVKDGAEAKEANLVAKKNLSSLSLVWEDLLVDDNHNSDEVIECLRPPPNLNELVIEAYRGSAFPTWVKLLMNVVNIQLSGCSECEDLPPLGHLPLLKKLCIFGMHTLKCVNKEFYGLVSSGSEAGGMNQGKGFFPSLEELEFREMPNWVEWQAIDGVKVFLCLQKLRLDKCPNLALLPIPIQRSVQKFEITRCEKLMVISSPI